MPMTTFPWKRFYKKARLLREQQGEENAIPATEEDAKPAPESVHAHCQIDETPQTTAQQPVKENRCTVQ